MKFDERALAFDCEGDRLVGVAALPATPGKLGVVLIVGGPQYRVGSHRQFVLFARRLAAAGIAVLRFDYRGMGDATGQMRKFQETGPDIAAALDALRALCPTVEKFVLWGLCDAASGALMYLQETRDDRVTGLVLLNPWVRSDETLARTYLKHYYGRRLLERAFWAKLMRGGVDLGRTLTSLAGNLRTARSRQTPRETSAARFQDRMASGFTSFPGPVLIFLSGRDLTAREFVDFAASDSRWTDLLGRPNVERHTLPGADHTFSSADTRAEVETRTLDWLRRMYPSQPR